MGRQQVLGERQLVPGRELAGEVPHADEDLRLVLGHPVRHPVGEAGREEPRVVGEPLRGVAVQPAAAAVEREREVPVEAGDPGLDPRREQLVDQPVVELEPLGVGGPRALGQHPGPAHAEAIGPEADLLHESDVLPVAVVVVAGHVARVAAPDRTLLADEHVPDGRALPVRVPAALDLVGGGGGAPGEAGGERLAGGRGRAFFGAPCAAARPAGRGGGHGRGGGGHEAAAADSGHLDLRRLPRERS